MDTYAFVRYMHEKQLRPADIQEKMGKDRAFIIAYAYWLLSQESENTKKSYKTVVDQFVRFLRNTRNINPLEAIGIDVALWREDLIRSGGVAGARFDADLDRYAPLKKTSIHNKISILSSLYQFLQAPGLNGSPPLITYNPVKALRKRFKIEKYGSSKKISIETLQKILGLINRNTVKGARDYALIYGYFMTGRRNSEWLTLKWGQINFNTDPITYTFVRKGAKASKDELPDSVLEAIIHYLQLRYGEDFKNKLYKDSYLFTALPGKGGKRQQEDPNNPLTLWSMLRIVQSLAVKAGIDKSTITVHSLRHLHAESYLELGASVEDIRSRLKHQSLATTQTYVSSMGDEKNPLAIQLDNLINLGDEENNDES